MSLFGLKYFIDSVLIGFDKRPLVPAYGRLKLKDIDRYVHRFLYDMRPSIKLMTADSVSLTMEKKVHWHESVKTPPMFILYDRHTGRNLAAVYTMEHDTPNWYRHSSTRLGMERVADYCHRKYRVETVIFTNFDSWLFLKAENGMFYPSGHCVFKASEARAGYDHHLNVRTQLVYHIHCAYHSTPTYHKPVSSSYKRRPRSEYAWI